MRTLNRPRWHSSSPPGTDRLIVPSPFPSNTPLQPIPTWDKGLAHLSAALWRQRDRTHTPDKWYPLSFIGSELGMSGGLRSAYLWEAEWASWGLCSSPTRHRATGVWRRTRGTEKAQNRSGLFSIQVFQDIPRALLHITEEEDVCLCHLSASEEKHFQNPGVQWQCSCSPCEGAGHKPPRAGWAWCTYL